MVKKLSFQNIIILFVILIIQYIILNGLEKIFFSQLDFIDNKYILRPSKECIELNEEIKTECLGLPSGHVEIITILSYLLFKYKYFSLQLAIFFIILMSFQRLYSQKHSIIQVVIGFLFGAFYGYLYLKTGLTFKTLILQFFFIFIFLILILFIVDSKIYFTKIPSWVDPSLLDKIKEKQNANIFIKLYSIITPSYNQDRFLFIDWKTLENKLNNIVNEIKMTNIQYDGVVGIKTGGAIISDYISNKLNIPNYKIKISTHENKCNKTTMRSLKTYYDIFVAKKKKDYMVCDKIPNSLSNKNIILIDESVASGGTIKRSIDYLLDEKKVSNIHACCIYKNNDINYRNIHIHSQELTNNICLIWPWGYDN